jgi:hypothetical protein
MSYLATGQTESPWGAREILANFLAQLRALPFAWTDKQVMAATARTSPALSYDEQYVQWPARDFTEAKGAWNVAVRYLGTTPAMRPFMQDSVRTEIPRIHEIVQRLPVVAPPAKILKAGLPWSWIVGGGLLIAGAAFFAGYRPQRGKKRHRKTRRRTPRWRPRRGRRR